MNFEIIKENKKKKIIIGGLIILSLVSALTFVTTRSKYKESQSIKIARGTVKIDNADLKIIAVKLSEDGTNYTDTNEVPTTGYTLNTDRTKCFVNGTEDTSITVTYENGSITISNVTEKGTKCNLYFDKYVPKASEIILAGITPKTTNPTFTSTAESNEGIYATSDGMYGGTTYYWRGAVTNNYVTFAGFCWRIIRINGDGSIRLIYDGTTCHANGTKTSENIALNSIYNSNYDNSSYVGWSYTYGTQRPNNTSPQTRGTRSPIRVTLEDTWYKNNITDKGYDGKVATGKFCNDRNTQSNETWRATGLEQYYAAYQRLFSGTKTPTTSCPKGDEYDLKIGFISADEVQFAGSSGDTANAKYYLYNGQPYWTMSPYRWSGSARMFIVHADGSLISDNVYFERNARPVINLRTDTQFQTGGNGSIDTPYVVQ